MPAGLSIIPRARAGWLPLGCLAGHLLDTKFPAPMHTNNFLASTCLECNIPQPTLLPPGANIFDNVSTFFEAATQKLTRYILGDSEWHIVR